MEIKGDLQPEYSYYGGLVDDVRTYFVYDLSSQDAFLRKLLLSRRAAKFI